MTRTLTTKYKGVEITLDLTTKKYTATEDENTITADTIEAVEKAIRSWRTPDPKTPSVKVLVYNGNDEGDFNPATTHFVDGKKSYGKTYWVRYDKSVKYYDGKNYAEPVEYIYADTKENRQTLAAIKMLSADWRKAEKEQERKIKDASRKLTRANPS